MQASAKAATESYVESVSKRLFQAIDSKTRIVFFTALGLNVFAYFIFYAHHPIHNHMLRMPWIDWNEQIYLGRWFNHVVLRMIHAADMPVFGPFLSSVIAVLMAFFTLKAWRLDLTNVEKFIIIGLITTFPFFLSFYYYTWLTPLFMFGPFFAAASLAFNSRLTALHVAGGAVLFMLMMASYQPAISVYAVVAAGSLIADIARPKHITLLDIAKRAASRILAALIGGVGYILSLRLLDIKESHATKPLELSDFPDRLVTVVEASLRHLTITQPEFHTPLKILLLALLIAAYAGSLWSARTSPVRLALLLPLWFGLIVAGKAMFLISADTNFFQYRYNTSMAFIYAFGVAMALHVTTFRTGRSLLLILAAFALLRFVQVDLVRQEVLLRGQHHDYAFANRILARVEALPDLDLSKTYDFVRVGKYSSFRKDLLQSKGRSYNIFGDGNMDHGEVTARWVDEQILLLLGTRVKLKNKGFDPNFSKKMEDFRARYAGKIQKWPHPESVFIEGDTIYVYLE